MKQESFQASSATTPLSWKLIHTSSDVLPLPHHQNEEEKREQEENPHQRHAHARDWLNIRLLVPPAALA